MTLQREAGPKGNSLDKLPLGTLWYLMNMLHNGYPVYKVLPEEQIPATLSKGWFVRSDIEVLKHVNTALFILQPGETILPFGDNFGAQQQMKAWEKELGGKVVHILVSDPAQRDTPWLAQPVLRSWLTGGLPGLPEGLVDLYKNAEEADPNKLRYRAAVIALTGEPPEKFQSKKKITSKPWYDE